MLSFFSYPDPPWLVSMAKVRWVFGRVSAGLSERRMCWKESPQESVKPCSQEIARVCWMNTWIIYLLIFLAEENLEKIVFVALKNSYDIRFRCGWERKKRQGKWQFYGVCSLYPPYVVLASIHGHRGCFLLLDRQGRSWGLTRESSGHCLAAAQQLLTLQEAKSQRGGWLSNRIGERHFYSGRCRGPESTVAPREWAGQGGVVTSRLEIVDCQGPRSIWTESQHFHWTNLPIGWLILIRSGKCRCPKLGFILPSVLLAHGKDQGPLRVISGHHRCPSQPSLVMTSPVVCGVRESAQFVTLLTSDIGASPASREVSQSMCCGLS